MTKKELIDINIKEFYILLSILNIDLNKNYYYSSLSKAINVYITNKFFRNMLILLKEREIIIEKYQEGSNKYIKIDKRRLLELIMNTRIIYDIQEKFVIPHLGSKYKFIEYN